jgi:hypothetical protein
MDLKKLKEPFPSKSVQWRVGKTTKDKKRGLALAYIDSRAVMNRLDDIVGPENWQDKYSFGSNGEIVCSIGIKIGDEWVWKTDGAGQTNFEAEKGGLSDAFKRVGVKWGIGRYLYKLDAEWVDLDKYQNIINPPSLPDWALPESERGKKGRESFLDKIRQQLIINKESKKKAEEYLMDINVGPDLKKIPELSDEQLQELWKKIA